MHLKQIINYMKILKFLNCYVANLYTANQLAEVAYLFGLVFFVKTANLGCFCNTQNDFGVRQQHQASQYFFLSYQSTFTFKPERYRQNINAVQWSDFLIMPGSCSYNCCVLIFDLVDLHQLVNLKNIFYFSMFSCIFPRLKRSSGILKGSSKAKNFFVKYFKDIVKIFIILLK